MRTTLLLAVAILTFTDGPLLASGHGAKKAAAHGSAAKKPAPDHGKKSHADSKDHASLAKPAPASAQVSDVERILSLIAGKEKRHDPTLYMEYDLGEYRVTHGSSDAERLTLLRIHVFAVLHGEEFTKFQTSLAGREKRVRDAVLSVVHRARYEQFEEPSLDTIKEELTAAINRVLEGPFVRDIAFSNFSMERR